MPQKFEFLITPRSSIWAKNRIDGYGAKSRWGPLRVHLGADGVPLGPKNGSKPLKITMQQNLNFWPFQGHQFGQKIEFTVMAPNHGGDPLGYIGWPMGPIGAKKWMKTVKNYHAPKLLLWGHRFGKISNLQLWLQITVGNPLCPSWGQCGPIGAEKWVKTVKNYHAPKFEFLTIPRSSIWAKNRIDGYGAKTRWGSLRVHLGADGVPLGPKNGSKPLKITMQQNSNFWPFQGHQFGQKSNLRLWRQITVGTP